MTPAGANPVGSYHSDRPIEELDPKWIPDRRVVDVFDWDQAVPDEDRNVICREILKGIRTKTVHGWSSCFYEAASIVRRARELYPDIRPVAALEKRLIRMRLLQQLKSSPSEVIPEIEAPPGSSLPPRNEWGGSDFDSQKALEIVMFSEFYAGKQQDDFPAVSKTLLPWLQQQSIRGKRVSRDLAKVVARKRPRGGPTDKHGTRTRKPQTKQ